MRELPRGVSVRRGLESDELATFDVMRKAMGYEYLWSNHCTTRHHVRESSCASFWVAEERPRFGRPRIIGYARSIVREQVWCLTEFFLHPDFHRRGIGGVLLDRCLEDGAKSGADTRMILASINPLADSLYIRKAGCIPRLPMLLMAGQVSELKVSSQDAATITDSLRPVYRGELTGVQSTLLAEPILLTLDVMNTINRLDREITGYARPEEHRLWATEMGGAKGSSRLFRDSNPTSPRHGEIVGYSYLGEYANGPSLAILPEDMPRMMAHVASLQSSGSRIQEAGFFHTVEHFCPVAGINEVVLRWLLDCGWRIVFQYFLMSSRPLGKLDRYVCHNPLYVL